MARGGDAALTTAGDETATLSVEPGPGPRAGDAEGPSLILLCECDRPLSSSVRYALDGLDRVAIGRAGARSARRRDDGDTRLLTIGVPDRRMSQSHATLSTELGRWVIEDAGSKNGVVRRGERIQRAVLDDGDIVELGHTFFLFRGPSPARLPVEPIWDAGTSAVAAPGLLTFVPPLWHAFAELAEIARTPTPVLVHGETGTGKELLARATHVLAGRPGPFVAVNCGALPQTLVESELFGYRKGAFSGATEDRPGLVRSAHGGTLFLDEIGDLAPASQAALLRVLQEREVVPLGASEPIPVDLRVVAATHHDLEEMVARNRFRRDLFARVAGYTLRVPPLRERRDDLGLLIAALLSQVAPERADTVRLSCDAMRVLCDGDWPLNVRELASCLRIAAALAKDGVIHAEQLPESVRGGRRPAPDAEAPRLSPEDERRRDELMALLREHRGNVSAVARATGKARTQIHRWLERYGLDPRDHRR